MRESTAAILVWLAVASGAAIAGCGGGGGADAGLDAAVDAAMDAGADTETETDADGPCDLLFGAPNENTGLTAAQCVPWCACADLVFDPPEYSESEIAAIAALALEEPFPELAEDPYAHPELHEPIPGAWCGALLDPESPGSYRLETYANRGELEAAGAKATHEDACGVCSPFVNLAVYMRIPDLTQPVRECALAGLTSGEAAHLECLQALGFDLPCAQIWYYNTKNTQAACFDVCMAALDDPYHEADGGLNECMACDEASSGEVFKAVAGRTRRNTGLPTTMCRPCAEVVPVVHDYL
jgi:hypothetical protein